MKLLTLIRENQKLVPAEVEIFLLPGLPQIQVLGLPDQVIKESVHRVRCALKAQGFQWPKARQVLVNIRPNNMKKSSRGLELAIAAGVLWQTRQLDPPLGQSRYYVYGELSLSGEVFEPEDLSTDFPGDDGDIVLTGVGEGARGFYRDRICTLGELCRPQRTSLVSSASEVRRPSLGLHRSFSEDEAQLISLAALGGFHLLLAGASGAGKTTLAQSLISFIAPPSAEDFRDGCVVEGWRPWIAPHHSSSALALIGGGVPPRRGEISRADRGVLFLDELLEFEAAAQEALREPVQSGVLRLGRGAAVAEFPARIQLVATTNLCPCGRWAPGVPITCGRSMRRCRATCEKISGPFFDRFELLHLYRPIRAERVVSGEEVLARLTRAREFAASLAVIFPNEADRLRGSLLRIWDREIDFPSERRRQATLRVAASLATLEGSRWIESSHFEQALTWTYRNFEGLRAPSVFDTLGRES